MSLYRFLLQMAITYDRMSALDIGDHISVYRAGIAEHQFVIVLHY
jgi:hypothetical protein